METQQTFTLRTLAEMRGETAADSPLLREHLAPPAEEAAPGFADLFSAACASVAPGGDSYRLALEYIFEGYLLHYRTSRLLSIADPGFGLLAGDYMYARGLNHITRVGDPAPIALLSALIQLCSFVHCEGFDPAQALAAWSLVTMCLAAHARGDGSEEEWRGRFTSLERETYGGAPDGGAQLERLMQALSGPENRDSQRAATGILECYLGNAGRVQPAR